MHCACLPLHHETTSAASFRQTKRANCLEKNFSASTKNQSTLSIALTREQRDERREDILDCRLLLRQLGQCSKEVTTAS